MLKTGVISAILFYLVATGDTKVISTKTGDIRGKTIIFQGQPIDSYTGVPYAEPPVGPLRFKPPVAVSSWNGTYDATQNPPACAQILCPNNCSEDCLYLNIWVPNNRTGSVMVWIYGGSFMTGSINDDLYNGSAIAALGGVIFAAMNYRLGPFGFLCSGTDDAKGNMGLKDQALAIKWIKDNIESFGGDPSKITLVGQSAGSISVSAHVVSPLMKNVFINAILESGTIYHRFATVRTSSAMKKRSNELAKAIGCAGFNENIGSDPKVLSCLRERSASSIIAAETLIVANYIGGTGKDNPWLFMYTPISGEEYLPNHPIEEITAGNINANSIMIGTVRDEGPMFCALFADPSLLVIDYPVVTRLQAKFYIQRMFRKIPGVLSKDIAGYYLGDTSLLNISLAKRVCQSLGDYVLDCPSVFYAEGVFANGKNVYYYIFNHRWSKTSNRKWMGVAHAEDTQFFFGVPLRDESNYTPEEKEFSRELIDASTSFANEGEPTYAKLSGRWPTYNNESRMAVELNPYNASYKNPYKEECRFWKKYF